MHAVSAYRTISEPAVIVTAGRVHVVILAKECKAINSRKGEGLREVVVKNGNVHLPNAKSLDKKSQKAGGIRGSSTI